MAEIKLDYTMRVRIDPYGVDLGLWPRIRLAASVLIGRPVLLNFGPSNDADTDSPANYRRTGPDPQSGYARELELLALLRRCHGVLWHLENGVGVDDFDTLVRDLKTVLDEHAAGDWATRSHWGHPWSDTDAVDGIPGLTEEEAERAMESLPDADSSSRWGHVQITKPAAGYVGCSDCDMTGCPRCYCNDGVQYDSRCQDCHGHGYHTSADCDTCAGEGRWPDTDADADADTHYRDQFGGALGKTTAGLEIRVFCGLQGVPVERTTRLRDAVTCLQCKYRAGFSPTTSRGSA